MIRHETLVRVLESSKMTDTTLLRIIDGLLRKGVFGVAIDPQGQLEETLHPYTARASSRLGCT